jgi:hypothetical protein
MLVAAVVALVVLSIVMMTSEPWLAGLFIAWVVAAIILELMFASYWPFGLVLVAPAIKLARWFMGMIERQDERIPEAVKDRLRQDAINNAAFPSLTGFGL